MPAAQALFIEKSSIETSPFDGMRHKVDELCVLAAHFDDGPCPRMKTPGKSGLGEDLIDEPRADDEGDLFSAAAGDAGGLYALSPGISP